MPLGTEIELGTGHIVLDGDPAPPERGTAAPHFSAHVYCGQTVAHLSNCWALVNAEDQDKFQNDIHRLNDSVNEWQLKLNAEKCCGMTYIASISNLCNMKYYNENGNIRYELVTADSVGDLRVRFDSKLAFLYHINKTY